MKHTLLITTALMLIVGITDAQTYQFANGFHDNGMVKEIKYHKKTRDGIELVKGETYYSSGQKESEGTYKDGSRMGNKMGNGRTGGRMDRGCQKILTRMVN